MYGQTLQNPTFGTITTKTNVEDNSAEKVLVQNSLGKLNWIYKNSLMPDNFTKIVYVNNTNPNSATIFDLNNPPTVNDNALKTDVNNLYIGTDASSWVYNSTSLTYVTKTITSTTSNFYTAGTTIDAGSSKTASITRSGNINTTGRLTVGSFVSAGTNFWVNRDITGSPISQSILADGMIKSDVTGSAYYNRTNSATQATSFTLPNLVHYAASQGTFGAGSVVTSQIGFQVFNNVAGAASNYGFRSEISAGANNWNTFMSGSAPNYFAGQVGIGTTALGSAKNVIQNNGEILALRNTTNGTTGAPVSRKLSWSSTVPDERASIDVPDTRASVNGVDMIFITRDNASVLAERMRIANGGNVGIGTTTPTEKLEVNGNITANVATASNHVVVKSQLDLKADIASPAFTGTPTAPTATAGTNTTQVATTAFVQANARPYKSYVAKISQTGTGAPVATVLENTIGGTIVWTRVSVGIYQGTLSGAFTNKTVSFFQYGDTAGSGDILTSGIATYEPNFVSLRTYKNGILVDTAGGGNIEIRVYP